MKKETIIDYFDTINLFHDLIPEEKSVLADQVEVRTCAPNEFLFKENTPRKALYLVFEGQVELFKENPFGEVRRLKIFEKHDFISEGALIEDYPHTTSARTVVHSTIMAISRDRFGAIYEEHPRITEKILLQVAKFISRRMRQSSIRAANIASHYILNRTRLEHDFLGEKEVPYEYYYGIQTYRALENFYVSRISLSHYPKFIEALAMVKKAAAQANCDLGLLPKQIARAIVQSCDELIAGKHHDHFVVDMIQGGAGTSTNMNANEVIANRALEIMGHERGRYEFCHPNNHVNLSQSTNDVYPSALKIAIINSTSQLISTKRALIRAFLNKADEFRDIIKIGRTQLQDAVPMTLGQEFRAFAVSLENEITRLEKNTAELLKLNMGGTAIGTGINTVPAYGPKVIEHLREISGLNVCLADDLIEATQDTGTFVAFSSNLRRIAIKLSKISGDLRLLSSGPRSGLNELLLPQKQPGSTIMPGKVNPVIPEVVNQIAYKVIGNDLTVTMASEAGQLQLNVMQPIIAQSLFESIEILMNGMATLKHHCIDGVKANPEHCRRLVDNSTGLVTALNPILGYEVSSNLAREALATNKSLLELVVEKGLLSPDTAEKLLDPRRMLEPQTWTGLP